jgi:hypothetical protein
MPTTKAIISYGQLLQQTHWYLSTDAIVTSFAKNTGQEIAKLDMKYIKRMLPGYDLKNRTKTYIALY